MASTLGSTDDRALPSLQKVLTDGAATLHFLASDVDFLSHSTIKGLHANAFAMENKQH